MKVSEGTLLWTPDRRWIESANLTRFARYVEERMGRSFPSYQDLWQWSVDDLDGFWGAVWDYFEVVSDGEHEAVLADRSMPGAVWFPGASLNFAEHVFRAAGDRPAILFGSETEPLREVSWEELRRTTAAIASYLSGMGVGPGDPVVSYMPNIPETIAAFLATASIGATWSSCSPDFGPRSVLDRFRQIDPVVLFATDGYRYGGQPFDRRPQIAELQSQLPGLRSTVFLPYLDPAARPERLSGVVGWEEATATGGELGFRRVPFDHPLWVVYTSGTTGLPKPIVHGHGGVLLESFKVGSLHFDTRPGDCFHWYSSTGWIMWNILVGVMLAGAPVAIYDGSVGHPDMWALWDFAERAGVSFLGVSAAYVIANMSAGISPGSKGGLERLRAIGSTGSPLPPNGFGWLYEHVKPDLWVTSVSGGTDVATAFVAGSPTLPVHAGELQCRALGCKVEAYDPDGRPLVDEVGELVVTEPMPSMPVCFWGDPDGSRYRESYFSTYRGVWRHGDWIKITGRGTAVIYGRSDSTINRKGVRLGTAEIYAAVEELPEVTDSLVVDIGGPEDTEVVLFAVPAEGVELDEEVVERIKAHVRHRASPRHVPDRVLAIPEVPRTLNGKKMEVPIKRILQGWETDRAVNLGSMSNPGIIELFERLADELRVP